MKNSIWKKLSYRQSNLKKNKKNKKKIKELEFHASFSKKLDFYQIEFQNRGTSLNSFKHGAFCWKVSVKWVFCRFGHQTIKEPVS